MSLSFISGGKVLQQLFLGGLGPCWVTVSSLLLAAGRGWGDAAVLVPRVPAKHQDPRTGDPVGSHRSCRPRLR